MRSAATAHRPVPARPTPGPLADAAIAVVALAGSLAQLSHGGIAGTQSGPGELDWTSGLLAACSTAPLLAWRLAPRAVFAFTASVAVLLGGLGYPIELPFGPTAALYLLAASRGDDEPWTPSGTVGVAGLLAAYLVAIAAAGEGFPESELVHTGLAWSLAWFAGERTRLRREHLAELNERALRAERDADRERRLAVAEERTRIARDLHDAAGHAISVIAIRAGTARMRKDPERSHAALEVIENVARRTAAEIDQIVGTLRDRASANGAVDAPPGLASLETLMAGHGATGLEVSVAFEGERRRLESAVDQAAYRILQEALTNAGRHGTGPARIKLVFGEAGLELSISNPSPGKATPRSNGGHGLIGMGERATLVGGSLVTERANGSFRVRAHLPYGGLQR